VRTALADIEARRDHAGYPNQRRGISSPNKEKRRSSWIIAPVAAFLPLRQRSLR
jgi:hypothetical protein